MWDLSGPGLEPVSPALADGFLTTASPGKSQEKGISDELKLRLRSEAFMQTREGDPPSQGNEVCRATP